MAESFGGFYVSTDYKDIIAFVLLVVILSIRPQGLFAAKRGALMNALQGKTRLGAAAAARPACFRSWRRTTTT